MDRIDMSLDDIIKGNKKKSRQPARTSTGNNNPTNNHGNNNNNNNNRNNRTTGPIRTRSAGKNLTRQKANPYPKPRISKAGNPNGVWRHDLFPTLNSGAQNRNNPKPNNNNNDNNNNNNNNNNLGLSIRQRLGNGVNNTPSGSGVVNRLSIKGAAGNQQARYSIKGEGGPATITVNNLAPGTSANDIKTAFMEFGEISTMNVDERFPANPVKDELTFESKASALAAIKKYNTALVDGYVLKVQLKQPGNNLNTGTGTATYRAKGKLNKPPVRANGKLYSDQLLSQRNRRVAGGNKGKQSSFGVSY